MILNSKKTTEPIKNKKKREQVIKSVLTTVFSFACGVTIAITQEPSAVINPALVGSTIGAFLAITFASVLFTSIIAKSKKSEFFSVYPLTTLIVALLMTIASISGSS